MSDEYFFSSATISSFFKIKETRNHRGYTVIREKDRVRRITTK